MLWVLIFTGCFVESNGPVVIAHRGASGYAIEHTEAAKAMAHAQGADYIEQDVVLSQDGEFVVAHDVTMEETTNVEQQFPDRARSDGRFFFADFTWNEIQQLNLHERTRRGSNQPALPHRFPANAGQRVLRLSDEIRLIAGLNVTTGKQSGLYIELKSPSFHKKEFGYSMGEALLKLLATIGIQNESDRCFIQCFEMDELKDLHERSNCKFPLIQLLGTRPSDSDLRNIALYAKGIGPSLDILARRNANNEIVSTGLVESAKQSGLLVHPYT
ncbi:MAG TPA: glycerophosphodiester phosphodiesterase family protein, partial [Pirellula sp.]|nr:glycerophosphodiester phosphodiesterase family protein [Pirellula sp.]